MALALQQEGGDPASELYRTIHRVAERMEPQYRQAFLDAVEAGRERLDPERLMTALRRKDTQAAVRALGLDEMTTSMRLDYETAVRQNVLAAGEAVATELSDSLNVTFSFDSTNPNSILAARRNAGTLIKRVSEESRLAVRGLIGDSFSSGVTPQETARRIRSVVGLRRDHARAVVNFREDLRTVQNLSGQEAIDLAEDAVDRRLDAVTKQKIRSAARKGQMTDELIDEATDTYGKSLLNRRANDIARTETIRASHAGQQETWRQAAQEGHIDRNEARRVWIVTPDDRLRESHAAIPMMNPNGVGMDEPFQTPMGAMMYPPAGVNCRCSVSLAPGGLSGGVI